jgi:DNA-binding response OmpR family regulator
MNDLAEENIYLREIIAGLTGEGDQPIEGLTLLQNKIVALLKKANGRTVKRSGIVDAIYWDRPDPPHEKSISVAIFKIGARRPDIRRCIENVYGFGYRWSEHDA